MKSILKTTLHHVVSIWNTSINTLTMGISIGIPAVISMFNSRGYSNIEVINADDLLYDNEPKPELKPEPEVEPEIETNTNTTLPECPICFELIDETSNRTITPCGHLFHTTCLMIHVCTNNNAHHSYGPDSSQVYNKTCPCCRAKLNKPSISGTNNDNSYNISEEFSSENGSEPTVNDLFRFIQPTSYELFQVLMHMEYAHSSILQYNNISRYSTFINRIEHARWALAQRNNSIIRDEETMNAEDDDLITTIVGTALLDEEDENENNSLPELISINVNENDDYEINSSPLQLNPDSLNYWFD